VIFFGGMIHRRFETIQAMFAISPAACRESAGVRMIRAFVQEKAEMPVLRTQSRLHRGRHQLVALQASSNRYSRRSSATFLGALVRRRQVLAAKFVAACSCSTPTWHAGLAHDRARLVVNLTQRGSASLKRINEILREQPAHRSTRKCRAAGRG